MTQLHIHVIVVVLTQSRLALCDPMDCNPAGSSVHGISQARKLDWVAISFSRGSSQPRAQTRVFCIADSLPSEPPEKPWLTHNSSLIHNHNEFPAQIGSVSIN